MATLEEFLSSLQVDGKTSSSIDLSWLQYDNATEYNIYRSKNSGSVKSDYSNVATVTSNTYTDSGLIDGEEYYYRVSGSPNVYGDGSDGSITDNSTDRSGQTLQTTNYTLTEGSTLDVNGTVIIQAEEYIEINGTIDANSNEDGGSGGSVSSDKGNPGQDGPDGRYIGGTGDGGSAGTGDGTNGSFACGGGSGGQGAFNFGDNGGDGGSGTGSTSSVPVTGGSVSSDTYLENTTDWEEFYTHPDDPAGGGAGGGAGGEAERGNEGERGGDGGRGGGLVILVAPEIRGSGTIDASGENGQSGEDGTDTSGNQSGAGGGGGGGCGGIIYPVYRDSFNVSTDVSGGSGGAGGIADSNGHDGGDGANGEDGNVYEVTIN